MKRLHELSDSQIFEKQKASPSRNYSVDPIQAPRVEMARKAIAGLLQAMQDKNAIAHGRRKIVELGANSGDVSGFFAWGHNVVMYEVSPACTHEIGKKWHWAELVPEDVTKAEPQECDLLVLCEILEHIPDPIDLVKRWMPKAKYCLISSPLRGDLDRDHSGGEHVHSFDETDFDLFVNEGSHVKLKQDQLQMGEYLIRFVLTKRKDSETQIPQALEGQNE